MEVHRQMNCDSLCLCHCPIGHIITKQVNKVQEIKLNNKTKCLKKVIRHTQNVSSTDKSHHIIKMFLNTVTGIDRCIRWLTSS